MKKDTSSKQKYTMGTLFVQILITIAAIFFITPIGIVINYSFKTKKELYLNSPIALAETFNTDNYIIAFKKLNLVTTFMNTVFYTAISVGVLVVLCGAAAWAEKDSLIISSRILHTSAILNV